MKTAKDYRAMAEECVKWAREARDDDVRAPLLQLAQTWLDAASKLDGLPANGRTEFLIIASFTGNSAHMLIGALRQTYGPSFAAGRAWIG